MTVFHFVLLTLASYRLTRLLTTDAWPPVEWFRDYIERRFGPDSSWFTLVTCPWCAGVYITFAVYAVDHFLWNPPTWLLAFVASSALVGYLGTYDETS